MLPTFHTGTVLFTGTSHFLPVNLNQLGTPTIRTQCKGGQYLKPVAGRNAFGNLGFIW